jgi:lipid A 3-O-deacylase
VANDSMPTRSLDARWRAQYACVPMWSLWNRACCAAAVGLLVCTLAQALEIPVPGTARKIDLLGDDIVRVMLGFGGFDMIREAARHGSLGPSPAGLVELRGGSKLAFFGPLLGVLANANGGLVGYGGVYLDGALASWRLTPFAAAGGYRRGEGKSLGRVFVFHLGGTISYQFANQTRLGITVTHTSNSRIYAENPGAESLLLSYAIPLSERD